MTDETRQDGSGGEAEKTLRHELTRALTTTVVERRDLSPTEMEEVGNLARLLPEAIEHSRYHGDALAETLSRPVEEALAISVKRDRAPMVEALAVLMGPALRKGLYEWFRSLIMALNRFVLFFFTWRGWAWRFEAMRTGLSFRDIVRRHQMSNPVKQVLLIHRESGLLLQQIQSGTFEPRDGDMVSGMLTAIQDFVHDSFNVGGSERLETIRVGDLTVWIEQGPMAILAGILQGPIPAELRTVFRDTLGRIQSRFHRELGTFRGDVAVFEETRPFLARCLEFETQNGMERLLPLTWLFLIAPVIVAGVWGSLRIASQQRWHAYLETLQTMPGIVVMEEGHRDGRYFIRGMRDPMANNPLIVMRYSGISAGDVDSRWELYRAMHPALTLPRARAVLEPPPTVSLSLADGVLTAEGSAPHDWIERARILAVSVDGVSQFRTERLIDQDVEKGRRWRDYVAALSRQPGLVVVEEGQRDGSWYISGLRDPLAPDPVSLMEAHGINPASVTAAWEPYQATDPALALQRAHNILGPPDTVTLTLRDGILTAQGEAPHRWIQDATILAKGLSGVSFFSTEKLQDLDLRELDSLKQAIEAHLFPLLIGQADLRLGKERELRTMTEEIKAFSRLARRTGREYVVEIRGHTKISGDEDANLSASATLARRFLENLKGENLDTGAFRTRGMGSSMPVESDRQRSGPHDSMVTIKITFLDTGW